MKREILFQGFHAGDGGTVIYIDGNAVQGRWVKGSYWEPLSPPQRLGEQEPPKSYLIFSNPDDSGMPVQICRCEVIPATVGQYTGFCDKNGKSIFENDVVSVPLAEYTFIVRFGKCGGTHNTHNFGYEGFYLEPADDKTPDKSQYKLLRNDIHYWAGEYEVEVIGTVFDSPDVSG